MAKKIDHILITHFHQTSQLISIETIEFFCSGGIFLFVTDLDFRQTLTF